MSPKDKLLIQILRGTSDANIPFAGLCQLLKEMGFRQRIRGDHHIFAKEGVIEILNLQPDGSKAKPYQVKGLPKNNINHLPEVILPARQGAKSIA